MAIDNETSLYTAENVLSTKPNEELRNQNKDTTAKDEASCKKQEGEELLATLRDATI